MDYRHYTTEDFVADDYFRQWVQHPDDENKQFWEVWIEQHPEKYEAINEAKYILQYLHFKVPHPEQADYLEVKRKVKQEIKNFSHHGSMSFQLAKSPVQWIGAWWKVAALFTGVSLLGILYFFFLREQPTLTYATDYGEIQNIVLPDSSTVMLNANSTLILSANWSKNREVWLEGEAFFAVQKLALEQGKNLPAQSVKFTVHTDDLDVEVLGTRFNVNERRGITKVVLNSGKVQIKNTTNAEVVSMQPGDLVAYSKADKKFSKKVVDPEMLTAWKEGQFVFEGTPIKDIAQMLEDTYGYEVTIADDTLARRKFTASIPSNNVETLLTLIAESLEVKTEKMDNEIVIKNK